MDPQTHLFVISYNHWEGTVTCLAVAATVMQRMNQRDVGSVLFLDMAVEIFGTWEKDRTPLTVHPATTVNPH